MKMNAYIDLALIQHQLYQKWNHTKYSFTYDRRMGFCEPIESISAGFNDFRCIIEDLELSGLISCSVEVLFFHELGDLECDDCCALTNERVKQSLLTSDFHKGPRNSGNPSDRIYGPATSAFRFVDNLLSTTLPVICQLHQESPEYVLRPDTLIAEALYEFRDMSLRVQYLTK